MEHEHGSLTSRGQAMINALTKYCRHYFLYQDNLGMDQVKVRMRSRIHRVEQADPAVILQRLKTRISDNKIGLLNPQNVPYEPVAGWPEIQLDELVLTAMSEQLDERVWQAVRSQFVKKEIMRIASRRGREDVLKDMSIVHAFPTSGFNLIKVHLAESEARMANVNAGFSHEQHFLRTWGLRLKKEEPEKGGVKKYEDTPNVVMAKERVLRETTLFLETVKDYLEKMLHMREWHLKSHVPIDLQALGTERDKALCRIDLENRPLQYPGGPPAPHSFKDQVMMEAPEAWPLKTTPKRLRGSTSIMTSRKNSARGSSLKSPSTQRPRKSTVFRTPKLSVEHPPTVPAAQRLLVDPDMITCFRKRWPPVWMSLACLEQGNYVVDPLCPTRMFNSCLSQRKLPTRHKSLTDVLSTRKAWKVARKNLSKSVTERLWREDKEKLSTYHVMFSSLAYLPINKEYPTQERTMTHDKLMARRRRQIEEIYDCELTEWYKLLVVKVHAEVGEKDERINDLLASIKPYFKMSNTSPKYGKAKLALVTMSLPAHVVLRIYVQRAIAFILRHVLRTPETLLVGWLTSRGLPYVLIEKHLI